MTVSIPAASASRSTDHQLAELIEELSARMEAGEPVDLQACLDAHPEHAAELRHLFPALRLLADFSRSGEANLPPGGLEPAPAVGAPLGDFRLLREIGRGGMGVVYEAEQLSLGRRVALKVLPFAATLDPKQLQRFKNEAHAAAQLHHTNIVPIHFVGCERGVHFYAMQFIDGRSLAHVITELRDKTSGKSDAPPSAVTVDEGARQASASSSEAARGADTVEAVGRASTVSSAPGRAHCRAAAQLAIQAAEALEHAHQLGVIHRDVKPANLLVDGRGTLWVADFGLAYCHGDAALTMTGDLVGTLRYMSPEQALAKRVLIDQRTDIYSLGVTLYELLTLAPAFDGRDRQELLRQIAFEEPVAPRRHNRAVPFELETIVLKAIAKNPAERYASARELADDCQRFLDDKPIRARRASLRERAWRWCRRNPGLASLSVLVCVLLVLAALGTAVAALLHGERNTALANLERAERAEAEATAAGHLAKARAYRFSGEVGQRYKALEEVAQALKSDPPPELRRQLRDEAIACLALPDSRLVKSLAGLGPVMALDPTFTHYAGSDSKGNISLCRVADGQLLRVLRGPGTHAFWLRFSPNGRFLATMHHRSWKWFVWNVDSGEIVLNSTGRFLDFSPDSRQVAVSVPGGGIGLVDLQSGKEELRIAVGELWECCAFDRQGRRLAVATAAKPDSVRIYELPSGAVLREIPMGSKRTWPDMDNLCWGADDTLLAAARDGGVVSVVDLRSGSQQALLSRPGASMYRVAFDPTGDLLATTGWNDSALRVWDARTGKQLLSKMTNIIAPQFSRDGRLIACIVGEKLELWEVTSGLAACRGVGIPPYRGGSGTVDFDSTGRILAMTVENGVSLWDCRAHREIAFLEGKMSVRALFDPSDCSLLVSGDRGLRRWPIRRTPVAAGEELVIGPPRLVIEPVVVHQVSVPAGAGLMALSDYTDGQAIILSWPGAAKEIARVSHRAVSNCALSPSGKWLAIGTWWGEGIGSKVYDAKSGKLAWEVPHEGAEGVDAGVAFSPDERWLVICSGGSYRFWQVGSWAPGLVIPGGGTPAFTRDGAIAAISSKPNQVTLVEVATGGELASLALPGTMANICFSFSPDDSRLAVRTDEFPAWIWDLRYVRQQLAGMGMDWDQPAYAPVGNEDDLPITKVTILRDESREPMRALTTAGGRNIRAWTLVENSKVKPEDARAAVELAQKAVAEKPEIAAYWNTLGVAHYRAGAWQSAALALGKSLKLGGYEDSDLLFLAMVQCQQGDKQQARETFGRACQWMEQHKPRPEEVLRFREEAAVLLGLNEKSASGKK